MTALVQGIRVKIWIIAVVLFLLLNVTGCIEENNRSLTVYPVLNNNAANSYIAADNSEAAVIDPTDTERIIAILTQKELKLKYIILTHGHFDHILGVDSLVSRYPQAKVLIHPSDSEKLGNPEKNLSSLFGTPVRTLVKSSSITENDVIKIGNVKINIIETPGHTQGSITLLTGDSLFSGDTLFKGAIGRTDFPGSSIEAMTASLKKLVSLPGDFKLYPGHGDMTSLAEEKKSNPFLRTAD